ncbi:MAG: cytochrome P450 [Bauldia sp.]|nr:cytochrome P450 [Bauldia sp.]
MDEIDFDHHAPDFNEKKYALYREMRGRCPVAHSASHGGYWLLSRYDDVFEVARNDRVFSSAREVVVPPTNVGRLIPLQSDPPELERFRSLLIPFFAPGHLKTLEPFIEDVVARSIDAFIERGEADIVTELANPVPSSTTMELLGLDPSEWRVFADPIHAGSYSRPGTPENAAATKAIQAFSERIVNEVDARIAKPRDDMISSLLASDYRGVATTREEVIDLVRMVIFGGMDTVMAALSNIFVALGRRPDLRDRLAADRALLPKAIEEFLRYDAPVQGFARTVTEDAEVGGEAIAAGDTVFMLWASANRDAAVFGDTAEELVLDRTPNRHMTFGIGAHRCLGSTLARIELRIVLDQVLDRIPDFEVSLDEVVEADTIGIVFGRRKVPITFTPGSRRRAAA